MGQTNNDCRFRIFILCWCLQYTQPLTSHSPPFSSMLTTTTKSWRSDTLIILPGWECHTGGSRSKPTAHRCSQSGRRLWVARQVHNHEPNGSATMQQETVHQCQHGSGAVQIHSTMSSTLSQIEGGDRQTFLGVSIADQSGKVVQCCVSRRSTVSVQAGGLDRTVMVVLVTVHVDCVLGTVAGLGRCHETR